MSSEDRLQAVFDELKKFADRRVYPAEEIKDVLMMKSTEPDFENNVRLALDRGFKLNILLWVRRDGSANLGQPSPGEYIFVMLILPQDHIPLV